MAKTGFAGFYALIRQNFPPTAKWSTSQIPSLHSKTIIVTGGTSGIGFETTRSLLSHGANVYILSRNPAKGKQAIEELKKDTGMEAKFIEMDLGDLASVRKAAEEFKRQESTLHVLINNAGIMMPPYDRLTAQGYDAQFGINLLGPFYLTELLLPSLRAGGTPADPARVVNVTSGGHITAPGIEWDTLEDGEKRRKKPLLDLYNQSKFAVVSYASEFARKRGGESLTSTSLHPGLIVTSLGRDMVQTVVKLVHFFSYKADQGALTTLYAATAPETAHANGKYFTAWAREDEPNPLTLDPATGEKLWKWCEEQVGKFEKSAGVSSA